MHQVKYLKRIILRSCLLFIPCLVLASITGYGQTSMNNEDSTQLLVGRKLSQENIHPLTIGDKIPDILLDSVINYPSRPVRLSDFKSKLTILDFWSSSCSACIGYFPHLQSLKDKFKNELQIVLVNSKTKIYHDNRGKINSVLRRLQGRSDVDIKLPIVFSSQELDNYFPWSTIPQEVWLNDKGVIIAITGAEEVTAANIRAILAGSEVPMHMKNDVFFDLQKKSLSELVYGVSPSSYKPLLSSVLIKGMIDGLGSRMGVRHAGNPYNELYTGWLVTNMPLLAIYQAAYRDKMKYPPNQLLIEAHDSVKFQEINVGDTSAYSKVYSYDITVPPTTFGKLMQYVQNDLERTFHVTVISEKRKIKCFVLRATPQSVKSYTKGGNREYRMERIDTKKYVRNYPIPELVRDLNLNYFKIPLINETGLTKNVDIEMPHDLSQRSIILALEKAGFEIKEEERDLDVAVIIDK